VPTFGTKWLLPRLAAFQRAHPGITVNLVPRSRPFLFDETALDAAIYAGEAGWPGTEAQFLMRENLIAVASPALIPPQRSLKAASLRRHVLLQQSYPERKSENPTLTAFRDWLAEEAGHY